MTKNQIKKLISENKITFFYLQFSDLLGQIKNIVIHLDRFWDVVENGLWFDGSSVEGFARIAESDMLLKPDLNTFAIVPWSPLERRAARVIGNIFHPNGRRLTVDPRFILQKTLKKAERLGFSFRVGAEFEFYLLERNSLPQLKPHDPKSYFDYTPHSRASVICESSMQALAYFGIKNEMHHHEVGQGQHEIDIRYDEALKTADNILTLKTTLKAYSNGSELKVSWMPKPLFDLPGNGLHIHQSLWKKDKNLFYSVNGKYFLSPLALHFLTGQLIHAPALSAIVSPTINSYKRLVPGYEAPVYICWGQKNRSVLIRIPESSKQKRQQSTRLEYRAPDPSANSYLAFAALLAAGLDGVNKKLLPPPPTEENVYHLKQSQLEKNQINTLPHNLYQAIEALEKDPIIFNIFGADKNRFLAIKKQEWQEFSQQVTDWEIEKYL